MISAYRTFRRSVPNALWYAFCSAAAVMFLFPFVATTLQSLKSPKEAAAIPPTAFPQEWSLANYGELASNSTSLSVGRSLLISLLIAGGVMVFTVVLALLAGYGLSRLQFPGSNIVFFLILITFMIPFQAVVTPLYLVLARIGLTNSLLGVILIIGTFQLPFGVFIMRNGFAQIPRELEESAMIDGCGIGSTLRRIMLPMAVPGILTTGLVSFFAGWNEFFAPLILLTKQNLYPLTVTLSILQTGQQGTINWGVLQAGVVVTILPCVVLFVLLQRYYVSGLVSGALK